MARSLQRLDAPSPELASGEIASAVRRAVVATASEETFLFVYVANASDLGIFLPSEAPLPVGTCVCIAFEDNELALDGEVVWVNPLKNGDNANPGMGVRFLPMSLEDRELVVSLVRAIAYLDEPVDAN